MEAVVDSLLEALIVTSLVALLGWIAKKRIWPLVLKGWRRVRRKHDCQVLVNALAAELAVNIERLDGIAFGVMERQRDGLNTETSSMAHNPEFLQQEVRVACVWLPAGRAPLLGGVEV